MRRDAFELAGRLAREAEAVCRHSLSNGKGERRDRLLGDVDNTKGRSLFVRLHDSSKGPAGKWSQHGARRMMARFAFGSCPTDDRQRLRDLLPAQCGRLRDVPRCF